MTTSEVGITFIKRNEGFVAHIYRDLAGNATVGYGHLLLPHEDFSAGLTQAEADALLRKDLAERFEPALNASIPATCTQNQFDALVDFAYNLGAGALRTMLGHGWDQVPNQIPRWVNVNGKQNAGLTERRLAEREMFAAA